MKTILRFALGLLIAATATAQASPQTASQPQKSLRFEKFIDAAVPGPKAAKVTKVSFTKGPMGRSIQSCADNVKVKIEVKYDEQKNSVSHIIFWPENGIRDNLVWVSIEGEVTEAEIPAGEYWASMIAEGSPITFVIKEHINVTDGLTLTFDTAEATTLISFQPKTVNGEPVNLPLIDFDYNILEPGNVAPVYTFSTEVFGPDNTDFASIFGSADKFKDEEGNIIDGLTAADILISPVSERFYATHNVITATPKGEPMFTNMSTLLNKSVTVSPYVDYTLISNHITPSPAANGESEHYAGIHEAKFIDGFNNQLRGETGCSSIFLTSSIYYSGLTDGIDISDAISRVCVENCDRFVSDDMMHPAYGISTPPMMAGGTFPAYNYTDHFAVGIFNSVMGEKETYSSSNFNEVYTRTLAETTGEYGNSVPMTSFTPMMSYIKEKPEWFVPNFTFAFLGMNGELRRIDLLTAKLKVNYGGETVCNSLQDANGWCWGWFAGGANRGVYDINLINDNVTLGDITGVNTTDIHFDLANDANMLPPLLQWMQYRNSANTVTPMLDKAQGSKLLFSAGIFDFNINSNGNMWFTCRQEPVNVKVEYAPHASGTYKELTINNPEDEFYMPGFGNQYEVVLDAINEKSTLGWFDLRVSLSDNYGNTMTQLFEPAFNIAALASLDSVGNDARMVAVAGRSIIVPEGGRTYDMSGRLTSGRDLAPGVYMVVTPTARVKVVMR